MSISDGVNNPFLFHALRLLGILELDVIERAGAVLATFQQGRFCWLNPKANDDSNFIPVYSYDHSAREFQRFCLNILC